MCFYKSIKTNCQFLEFKCTHVPLTQYGEIVTLLGVECGGKERGEKRGNS